MAAILPPISPIGRASICRADFLLPVVPTQKITLLIKELAALVLEAFSVPEVSVTVLLDVPSKYIYVEFTSAPSPQGGVTQAGTPLAYCQVPPCKPLLACCYC